MPLPRRSSEDQVTATFLRGLTIGALVGAVIAGSSMLTRRRVARSAVPVPTSDMTPAVDAQASSPPSDDAASPDQPA